MNVIFVGGYHPKHLLEEIKDLGSYVDYASYTFHTALVSGLDHWFPNLKVVSSLRVDAYPKVKKIYFKPERYSHNESGEHCDRFVGLINLPGIKMLSSMLRLRRNMKAELSKDNDNYVITYSLNSRMALAVATLRHRIKRCCYVIPDLPEYMSEKNGILRKTGKSIDKWILNWAVKRFDCFALLSPHMAERLPIAGKPWHQMEGIYQIPDFDLTVERPKEKAILYTGTLGERYGIIDLLDAFEQIIDPNYRLWIRGGGACKAEVLRRAELDSRIKYIEPLSKEDLLKLHRKASVLVNPVRKSQEFTRYFFPSKTMEYLASGTPVIMYHLDCIPQEYDEYLNYIEEETIESLRDKILEVCESKRDEAILKADHAADFIKNQKNAVAQTKIIYDLLTS